MNCSFCEKPKAMPDLTFLPNGQLPIGIKAYRAACTDCQRDGTARKKVPIDETSRNPSREPGSDDE